jgi:hypothetical protein
MLSNTPPIPTPKELLIRLSPSSAVLRLSYDESEQHAAPPTPKQLLIYNENEQHAAPRLQKNYQSVYPRHPLYCIYPTTRVGNTRPPPTPKELSIRLSPSSAVLRLSYDESGQHAAPRLQKNYQSVYPRHPLYCVYPTTRVGNTQPPRLQKNYQSVYPRHPLYCIYPTTRVGNTRPPDSKRATNLTLPHYT